MGLRQSEYEDRGGLLIEPQSGPTIDRTQSLTAREAGICSLALCAGGKGNRFFCFLNIFN